MSRGWFITPHSGLMHHRCPYLRWCKACRTLVYFKLGFSHHISLCSCFPFVLLFPSFSSQVFQFFSQLRWPFLLPSQPRQRFRPCPVYAQASIRPSAVGLLLPLALRASGTNRAPGEAGCNHSDSSSPEQICIALERGRKGLFKGGASSRLCIRLLELSR